MCRILWAEMLFCRATHCYNTSVTHPSPAYVSFSPGTITNPGPRRSIPALVYLRAVLYLPELVWACLGALWVSDDSHGCDPATVGAVIAAVITRLVGKSHTHL